MQATNANTDVRQRYRAWVRQVRDDIEPRLNENYSEAFQAYFEVHDKLMASTLLFDELYQNWVDGEE